MAKLIKRSAAVFTTEDDAKVKIRQLMQADTSWNVGRVYWDFLTERFIAEVADDTLAPVRNVSGLYLISRRDRAGWLGTRED
jgi:hypothetical protein